MDPKDAARIAAGMLRGLQHAHEEGVVHRDVKPDNVLITKGDEPKLLDFGLAIETETALQITKDGMVVGTPYYLAPEQARGQKATPLCDVYAAGVTLYYLLTGKRPFVGATALAVLNKHIHEPPVPPIKHKADIPKTLNDIVLKMMAKKPADRYQSAAAAAKDLEAYLKGKQVEVRVPVQLPLGLDRLSKKQQIIAAASAGVGLMVLVILLIAAFSGGKRDPDPTAINNPPPPPPAGSPEADKLKECLEFESKHKDIYDDYALVFTKYDQYIASTVSTDFAERGKAAKKAFFDYAEKRAVDELDKILKESDPYKRVRLLADYPRSLLTLTTIDKRVQRERTIAGGESETKYLSDEKKLDGLIRDGKFKEAGALLEVIIGLAVGPQRERLDRLKADLPRMEREYDDALLRRLTESFGAVHTSFSELLAKRDTLAAYNKVTKFLKDVVDPAEKQRLRVPGVNYETIIHASTDAAFKDTIAQVPVTLATAFVTAQDTLSYRVLSSVQDALDVDFLVTAAYRGMRNLSNTTTEIRIATWNQTGRMLINPNVGLVFQPKGGVEKKVEPRQLNPEDLVMLAAASEGVTIDKMYESSDLLARAIGTMYLYSTGPDRWAQAIRWFRRAEELGIQGLSYRLAGFRERGYQEVRDRIAASKALLDKKNFDGAKQPLAAVQAGWDHDPVLKEQIGRAMAAILVAEVLHYERTRDYAKLKQAARTLRSSYAGLYREEDVFAPYAMALRLTGTWGPAGSRLNDEWTWEGKAQGAPSPATDDSSRGLHLKPDTTLEFTPNTSRGVSGAVASLTVANTATSFATGIKFDASAKDGRYRKLVIHDTGEAALYESDGSKETRIAFASGKKLGPGEWIEIAFVAEGGDLVCFVAERPLFLVPATISTDRAIGLWTSADANFRLIRLRK
jgi:hypothetical protein